MTDIASLGFAIDSKEATSAASALDKLYAAAVKLDGAADKLNASQKQLNTTTRTTETTNTSASRSADDLTASYDRMRAALDPVYASSKNYEAALELLNKQLSTGSISQAEYNKVLQLAQDRYLNTGVAAKGMGNSIAAAQAHTTNLMFQFQDIGMMLAAGQNPLMLAMQQGTQVSGVFHQMRQTGMSAFAGIRAGLLSMLSPMSLLTIGVIAGGAALTQWAFKALSAKKEADEFENTLEELNASIDVMNGLIDEADLDTLTEKYGEVTDSVLAMLDAQMRLERLESGIALSNAAAGVAELSEELFVAIDRLDQAGRTGKNAAASLISDFNLSEDAARELGSAIDAVADAEGPEQVAAAYRNLYELAEQAAMAVGGVSDEEAELLRNILDAEEAARRLAAVDMASNFSSAADQAGRISDNLSQAVRVAASLDEAMRRQEVRQGAILLNYKDAFEAAARGVAGENTDILAEDLRPDDPVSFGGGVGIDYDDNLNVLKNIIGEQSEEDALQQINDWYARANEALANANLIERGMMEEHNAYRLEIEQSFQDQMAALRESERMATLQGYSALFSSMASIVELGGKKTLAIQKALSIASATIAMWAGAAEALKLPYPANLAAWAKVISLGTSAISGIQSTNYNSSGSSSRSSGSSTSTTTTTSTSEPERFTRVSIEGDDFLSEFIQGIFDQIYDESDDGRVIVRA